MRLLKQLLAIAALLSLGACIVLGPVPSYSAADGSSQATYKDGCVSPYPLSSTIIFDRPDVQVRLNIYGVHGDSNMLFADILVEPRPGTIARLLESSVEVISPDFGKPLSVAAYAQYAPPGRVTMLYGYKISMPTIPTKLSMRFPKLETQGQIVDLPQLVLRNERRLLFIDLMCQV